MRCSNKIATMRGQETAPDQRCIVDLRELKALELAARSKIVFHLGRWLVPSQGSGKVYSVSLSPPSCSCEDFELRGEPCKHVIADRVTLLEGLRHLPEEGGRDLWSDHGHDVARCAIAFPIAFGCGAFM
jgi:hypothetical protein